MQTFLPYPDFDASARALDDKRLGNQCYRETFTLLNGGWPNHPASRMWRGHERSLAEYGLALAREMERRGTWSHFVTDRWIAFYSRRVQRLPDTGPPSWLGDEAFHAAHRSNLLRKDPEHYGDMGWKEPADIPYEWPSTSSETLR